MYIVGRVEDGEFRSYRGLVFENYEDAVAWFDDEFDIKRLHFWTIYEAHDAIAHLDPTGTVQADQR